MRGTIKRERSLAICAALLLFVLLMLVLMTLDFAGVAYAEAETSGVISDVRQGLENYAENVYPTTTTWEKSPNAQLQILGEDPIVNYIPKSAFTSAGEHLYIGRDYGYFVYTFVNKCDSDYLTFVNKQSVVLVFLIDYDDGDDDLITKDTFNYTIQPLFQREYITIMPDDTNGYIYLADAAMFQSYVSQERPWNDFIEWAYCERSPYFIEEGVENVDGIVVPLPQLSVDNFYYADVEMFYLSDISIGATLSNEQDVNYGETGYDVAKDAGMFFINTGIDISAYEYSGEQDDLNIDAVVYTAEFAANKIINALFGASGVPFAGTAFSLAQYIINLAGYLDEPTLEYIEGESYYGVKDFPSTKHGQLEASGGYTYKSTVISMDEQSGVNAWLGHGHHFTGFFEMGSDSGVNPGWRTNIYTVIDVGISCTFSDMPTFMGSTGFFVNTINDRRSKPLAEDSATEAYVKAPETNIDGKDRFAFTAPRHGLYEVVLTDGTGVNYQVINDVDQTVCEPVSDEMYYFEEGQDYIIELANTTSTLKRPTVEVGMTTLDVSVGDSIGLTLPAGAVVGLKIDFEDEFTDITVVGDNVRIYGVTEDGFMPEEGAYTTNLDQIGSGIKYLWVENTAGQTQSFNMEFEDVSLALSGTGGTYAFDSVSDDYYTVVKFDLDDSYIYCLELALSVSESSPDFVVYNSDGVINTANRTPSADNKRFTYLLNVGSGEGYLAVRGGGTYTVGVSTSGEAGDWYINGELASTYSYDSYGAVILEQFGSRNAEYTVQYITKSGTVVNELNYIGDNVGIDFNPSSGVITITPSSPYARQNIYFTRNGNVANPLKLTFAVRRGPGFYFEYTRTPLMLKLHYDASSPLDEVTLTAGDHTYTFDCAGKNGVIDLSSQIKTDFYDAYVLSATFAVSSYTMIYSEAVTYIQHPGGHLGGAFDLKSYSTGIIPYAGGNGFAWNPYQITTRAELEYMGRQNTSLVSYELMNDIDLGGENWTPISTFSGILIGNDHAITNMRIHVSDTSDTLQRYGFVAVNQGLINNVVFKNAYITASNLHYTGWLDVGIVAGYNKLSVSGCSVNGTLEIHRNNSNIGGIVGENAGTVTSSKFGELHSSKVMGNGEIGGIAGKNTLTVSSCHVLNTEINFWEVYQGRSIGGIVGYNPEGTISDCGILSSTFIFSGYDSGENAWLPNFGYIAGSMEGDSSLIRVGKTDDVTYDFSAVISNSFVPHVSNWFKGGWGETGYRASTVYVE